MMDALLVSDQQVGVAFLPKVYAGSSTQNFSQDILALPGPSCFSGNSSFYDQQTLQGHGTIHHLKYRFAGLRPSNGEDATIAASLGRAKAALDKLTQSGEHAQKHRHFQEEMRWLAENRHKFRGRWVALEGERLLAEGSTAREVFSKVADQKTPPLVVQIVDQELPFAGW